MMNLKGASPSEILMQGMAVLRARWYLRSAKELASTARVWGRPFVRCSGNLIVEDRARIISTIATTELAVEKGGTLILGRNSFINYGCSIAATKHVEIGPRTTIGTNVIIMDNDFHTVDPDRRHERPPSAPIIIGENVWICARVLVLRGVTIGDNSVIAAGSIVSHDIPANSVAAGQPAKVIRPIRA